MGLRNNCLFKNKFRWYKYLTTFKALKGTGSNVNFLDVTVQVTFSSEQLTKKITGRLLQNNLKSRKLRTGKTFNLTFTFLQYKHLKDFLLTFSYPFN